MLNFIENIKYFFILLSKRILTIIEKIKKFEQHQFALLVSSILLFIFLISFLFFVFERGDRERHVLFFPNAYTYKLVGEERYIKKHGSESDQIKNLVDELILGPTEQDLLRIFPAKTKLITLILTKDNLSLNFSEDLLSEATSLPLSFENSILSSINTIRFNYPSLKKIDFYIHGEELSLNITDKKGNSTPLENVGLTNTLLK
jgi:hypothetical protein